MTVSRSDGGGRIAVDGTDDPAAAAVSSTGTCDYVLQPWIFEPGTTKGGFPPTPQHRRFIVSCNRVHLGTVWIAPGEPAAPAAQRVIDLRGIAERVVRQISLGAIDLGVRPGTRGITGIPSLFWVEGYDGRPLQRSISELGVTVDVRVILDTATWDFGDGSPPTSGIGRPWPARSDVRHAYARTSPEGEPYAVRVDPAFRAEYRVDGGAWQRLAPLARTAAVAYDVNEVQAVRNR
ncbi:hypothetical protein BH18ACT1_BH18ACT1_14210 [soil metagenome]